jgi:hypothetical protein
MVKVMCCHLVSGSVLKLDVIQLSVARLPQEGQKRDLHECGTLKLCAHLGQEKRWKPSQCVRQTRSFRTLTMMDMRINWRYWRKSFHQLPLSKKMSRSFMLQDVTCSIKELLSFLADYATKKVAALMGGLI